MCFVDTSVLLYSVSTHRSELEKATAATALLGTADLCLSVQVLQEFYVQSTRASRPGALTSDTAIAFIDTWLRFRVQEMSVSLMRSAFLAKNRWQISYWDAAIIEAARNLGCKELYSEDLNDGQDYGGVRVVNPFL